MVAPMCSCWRGSKFLKLNFWCLPRNRLSLSVHAGRRSFHPSYQPVQVDALERLGHSAGLAEISLKLHHVNRRGPTWTQFGAKRPDCVGMVLPLLLPCFCFSLPRQCGISPASSNHAENFLSPCPPVDSARGESDNSWIAGKRQ